MLDEQQQAHLVRRLHNITRYAGILHQGCGHALPGAAGLPLATKGVDKHQQPARPASRASNSNSTRALAGTHGLGTGEEKEVCNQTLGAWAASPAVQGLQACLQQLHPVCWYIILV